MPRRLIEEWTSELYDDAGCDPAWPDGLAPLAAGALRQPVLFQRSSTSLRPGAALVYSGNRPQIVVHNYRRDAAVTIAWQMARSLAGWFPIDPEFEAYRAALLDPFTRSILIPNQAVQRLFIKEGHTVEWIEAHYPISRGMLVLRLLEALGRGAPLADLTDAALVSPR